jgi:hypothetical protein
MGDGVFNRLLGMRYLAEGICAPWWLGRCWYEWEQRRVVAAPIGLNVLYAYIRLTWLWVRFGASRLADKLSPAAREGERRHG